MPDPTAEHNNTSGMDPFLPSMEEVDVEILAKQIKYQFVPGKDNGPAFLEGRITMLPPGDKYDPIVMSSIIVLNEQFEELIRSRLDELRVSINVQLEEKKNATSTTSN